MCFMRPLMFWSLFPSTMPPITMPSHFHQLLSLSAHTPHSLWSRKTELLEFLALLHPVILLDIHHLLPFSKSNPTNILGFNLHITLSSTSFLTKSSDLPHLDLLFFLCVSVAVYNSTFIKLTTWYYKYLYIGPYLPLDWTFLEAGIMCVFLFFIESPRDHQCLDILGT